MSIFVYGAGKRGLEFYRSTYSYYKDEYIFIDISTEKQKNGYYGCRVISPEIYAGILRQSTIDHNILIIAVDSSEIKKDVNNLFKLFLQNGKLSIVDYKEDKNRIIAEDRRCLRNKDFSIISNNCWGGVVYKHFGLPYLSPTAGLFFLSDDYLKFVKYLKDYISGDLVFINSDSANRCNECKKYIPVFGEYPIGRIRDINIHFLHYKTDEEAYEKWKRRAKRINWNNLIVKNSTQNLWNESEIREFSKLPYKNKIVFTSRFIEDVDCQYIFKEETNDTTMEGERYPLFFDVLDYLNNA